MKIIGLTGGIGSGKSTVTEYLISRGFHVLDADKIAREIVTSGSDTLIELVSIFGKEILQEEGSLDRKKLGSIVFSDIDKKKKLDELMHARILETIHERILKFHEEVDHAAIPKHKAIFIDAPLLFETGLDKSVNEIWVIDVEDETRIKRIIERDGLKRDEILQRINAQMPRNEKIKRADTILDNNADQEQLYQQLDKLLLKI